MPDGFDEHENEVEHLPWPAFLCCDVTMYHHCASTSSGSLKHALQAVTTENHPGLILCKPIFYAVARNTSMSQVHVLMSYKISAHFLTRI